VTSTTLHDTLAKYAAEYSSGALDAILAIRSIFGADAQVIAVIILCSTRQKSKITRQQEQKEPQ
jgi:hypothetical protein